MGEQITTKKTQADFDAAITAGNYDFSEWEFSETIRIQGDHSEKNFNFHQAKITGDLYARAATFHNLYARAATFRDLDASEATFNDLYVREATFNDLDASEATFNDLDASEATFNDLYAREATFNDLYAREAKIATVDFSGAKWAKYISSSDYLATHFEKTEPGYIVYKTFNQSFAPPPTWKLEPNSILEEIVNPLITIECGAGINVAPLSWVKSANTNHQPIWKCLIEWEWLADVVVPLQTDGKIRCGKLRLLEIVTE
jgi:hypothetical protein